MVYSTVFMPYEVGDYSLFVREDLKDYAYVLIIAEDHLVHMSKEVLPSEAGTIIYFKEKIKDMFFEGMLYGAHCYTNQDGGYAKFLFENYLRYKSFPEEEIKAFLKADN